ncbi:hypothetical protein OPIT5_04895 [Opitutaceae bacterium TAV5]|nr:hypothetical protein OPIT5_04895 [Opitutaceae bacterium TAV5]
MRGLSFAFSFHCSFQVSFSAPPAPAGDAVSITARLPLAAAATA